ncbi:cellulase family glycosylhydrolase [Paracoccus sp. MC1862]|uniref:cellulase family glycosylhydrolase n=1 Tax=Paracoccus sp. MC1862 TaxID=2760307 RepID=UPI00190D3E49|nr:cellulase family glycosylhydrolase [Paracoccus sp. MC1862]QQO46767.1 cellulase family glycosylhydrolase [Paracoccus sp. MC1862]
MIGGIAAILLQFGFAGGAAVQASSIPDDAVGLAVGLDALRWQDSLDLRAEFADYAAMGVRWLRTDLNWASIQRDGPDSFDWSEMDRIVDLAASFGIGVLPVAGSTPEWAWANPEDHSPPGDPQAFGRFLEAAVRRYEPRGIDTWEIWNEPNLDGPFPPRPDPVAFAAILKAAHAAIRAADPDATVILGGLAAATSTDRSGRAIAAVEFLQRVYDEGAGGSFDALGFHPYTGASLPDLRGWRNSWALMAGPIRDLMAAHGDAEKKIWITEYGAPTNEAEGGAPESRQAEQLAASVDLARVTPWLGPVFWYSYRDLGTDPKDREDWFGLMAADGRVKPAREVLESIDNK